MDGKKLIYTIIIITIIAIIGTLIWGEFIIEKYDLERAMVLINLTPNLFFKYFV